MKRWYFGLAAGLCLGALAFAACGGGGDDGDKTVTGTQTNKTKTAATAKSGTPGASGTAVGTTAAGTPGNNATAGANTTPGANGTSAPGSSPAPGETPRPGETIAASNKTPVALEASTPTSSERDALNEDVPADFIGGDIDAPPEVLTDLPALPPGATIDPTTIGPTNVTTAGVEAIVDLSASEPGIQSTRTIKVGDVIRVGLVLTNVPDTGLAAFRVVITYDKTKIVAPTIINGSSLSRNPDHNEAGLGSGPGGWSCLLPAPEGDTDDPGGLAGDGDPATGEALLECLGPPPLAYETGVVVFATVQFQALAPGNVTLAFSGRDSNSRNGPSEFADSGGSRVRLGTCGGDDPPIPCRSATLTVQ